MLDTSLAVRYANALFGAAKHQDCVEAVLEDMKSFITILSQHAQLKKIFFHPAIPPLEKKRLLDDIVKSQFTPVSRNFLSVLLYTKRINYISLVHETLVGIYNREKNRVKACVWSVFPIDPALRQKVEVSVAHYLQKEVDLVFMTDPDLLGGIKLTVEDKVIDGSVLYNLKKLETRIALG
jgi:F-type H+-transporting ATPase subunit delta